MVLGSLSLSEMEQMTSQWFLKHISELELEERKVHKQSDPPILLWVNFFTYKGYYCVMVGGVIGEWAGLYAIISTKM